MEKLINLNYIPYAMNVNEDSLYKILAIGYYNGERRRLCHRLLKQFLNNKSDTFDIDSEISKMDFELNKDSFISDLFSSFDSIITSGLAPERFLEYVKERYGQYEDTFYRTHGLPLSAFIYLAFELVFYINDRPELKIVAPVYQFESKEDYANLKFIAYPSQEYINAYKKVFTVNIDDFKNHIIPIAKPFLDKFISLYSFNLKSVNEDFRIKEYPLLHIDDSLIFVDPSVYLRYISHKIHLLLNGCKNYDAKKGKNFEKMGLDLIEKVPYSKLEDRNIPYNGYELDGLLNLRRSTWFIECKSRNIRSESLLGDSKKISKDVKKAIKDSIKQGQRAIDNMDCEKLLKYNIKRVKGIIIILEGIFPNIRTPKIMGPNPIDSCKYPVCVFNYFELKKILEQEDSHVFEEFLIWRGQKNMPIYAFDECDYWAYFNDNYRKNKEIKKAFKLSQQKNIVTTYISARFNKKEYLSKLIKEDKF